MNVKESNTLLPEEQEKKLTLAQSFVANVNEDLNDIKHSFLKIGYELNEADKNGYYKELGYTSLIDLAEDIWGFGKSTTYNLIDVYKLAHDPSNPKQIAPQYDKFSQSHLVAITRLKYASDTALEIIKISECGVRDLEKFISLWNKKYAKGSGYRPECKTVAEYLRKYEAEDNKQQRNFSGQLPGQQALEPELFQTSGKTEVESSAFGRYEVQICPEIDEEIRVYASEAVKGNFLEVPQERSKKSSIEYTNVTLRRETPDDVLVEYCLIDDIYLSALPNKFAIYDRFYLKEPTPFFTKFIVETYGNFSVPDNWGEGEHFKRLISDKKSGLLIQRLDGVEVTLNWYTVTGKIMNLIMADRYLTPEEKEKFPQWKAERSKHTESEPEAEIFQTSGKSDEEHSLLELREITPEIVECEVLEVLPEQNKEIASDDDEDYTQHSEPQKRPESEIIKVGLTGVDIYVKDAKFRIYDRYRNAPLKGNFAEFIKSVYDRHNQKVFYHGFAAPGINRSYSEKGVEFVCFDPYQNVKLTWEEAARHISDLIYTDEYLSEEEQAQYLNWKAKNEGLKVAVIDSIPAAEPTLQQESKIFQTSGKTEVKTQRARLSELSTYDLVNEIVMKIVKIYPLKGESIKFVSAVRKGLVDWLDALEV